MKIIKKLIFSLILLSTYIYSATLNGDEILQLHSGTTAEMNAASAPVAGHIILNTDTNSLWHYDGTNWVETDNAVTVVSADADNQIKVGSDAGAYLGPTVYTGFFIINANGSKSITGLPFQPSQITFVAHANVESLNIDAGGALNSNTIDNSFGSMNGFARDNNGVIIQQVIYVGGSGRSINNISRFSSDAHCIGLRYGDQNGNDLGKITASLSSFDTNGFTINITRTLNATSENLVVLYTAYK